MPADRHPARYDHLYVVVCADGFFRYRAGHAPVAVDIKTARRIRSESFRRPCDGTDGNGGDCSCCPCGGSVADHLIARLEVPRGR